jgi:hypothetical protein
VLFIGAAVDHAASQAQPVILGFQDGVMQVAVPTNEPCYVEWASSVDGPWKSDWLGHRGIMSSTGVAEVQVPRFFRVTRVVEPVGLVAYFPFNDAPTDASGNGHHATLFNGASIVTNGKFGGAIQLDGVNDYARVAASDAFRMTNFTLSAWVSFDRLPAPAMPILSTMTGTLGNGGMQMDLISDRRFYMEFRSSTQFHNAYVSNGVFSAEDTNRWRMVTSTCSWSNGQARARMYLDGYPIGAYEAASDPMAYNNQVMYIGVQYDSQALGGGFVREYDGKIDEIRIYNRALTDSEVLSLYMIQR